MIGELPSEISLEGDSSNELFDTMEINRQLYNSLAVWRRCLISERMNTVHHYTKYRIPDPDEFDDIVDEPIRNGQMPPNFWRSP